MKLPFLIGSCLVLLLAACGGGGGRIMGDSEADLVGDRAAGAATYDRLIEGAVQELLRLHRASYTGEGKLEVAFLGIDAMGIEELADAREGIFELIDTSVDRSETYKTISDRFVRAALRQTRLNREELFLPAKRREFLEVLEAQKNPVEALLFAKLTTISTGGTGVKQRNYLLTLELVDVETGHRLKVTQRLRKEYTR